MKKIFAFTQLMFMVAFGDYRNRVLPTQSKTNPDAASTNAIQVKIERVHPVFDPNPKSVYENVVNAAPSVNQNDVVTGGGGPWTIDLTQIEGTGAGKVGDEFVHVWWFYEGVHLNTDSVGNPIDTRAGIDAPVSLGAGGGVLADLTAIVTLKNSNTIYPLYNLT